MKVDARKAEASKGKGRKKSYLVPIADLPEEILKKLKRYRRAGK